MVTKITVDWILIAFVAVVLLVIPGVILFWPAGEAVTLVYFVIPTLAALALATVAVLVSIRRLES